MPNKRADLGSLISGASSDIQPIKRGAGLSGLIGGRGPSPAPEQADEPEQTAAAAPASAPAPAEPAAPGPAPRVRADRDAATPAARPARPARGGQSVPATAERRTPQPPKRPAAESTATRQNKTIRLKSDLARRVGVLAAQQDAFEYALVEEAIDAFLARGAPPAVTRPRDTAEMAGRVRKSYTLRPEIIRDVAVQAATWDVFEYEIFEAALDAYLSS